MIQDAAGQVVHEASFPAGEGGREIEHRWEGSHLLRQYVSCESLDKNRWKDMDPWLQRIKDILFELTSQVTLLWIPAHCDIEGNERADELARRGTEMNQDTTIVTHKIVKAKIKNRQCCRFLNVVS